MALAKERERKNSIVDKACLSLLFLLLVLVLAHFSFLVIVVV